MVRRGSVWPFDSAQMTILSPADEVHIYNVCTALTDAMEVQPSMQWKIGLKTVLLLEFHIVQTDIS